MKEIRIIQKLCSLYTSLIIIVKVFKLNNKWKIRLYNNNIDFNKIIIRDVKLLPNFQMIFDKMNKAVVYIIINIVIRY